MHILVLNIFLCVIYTLVIWMLPVDIKKKENIFLYLSFIQLVIIHTFIGTSIPVDIPEYQEMFRSISSGGLSEIPLVESLFYVMMLVSSKISDSFVFFLLIYSVVFLLLYYKTIIKYSPYLVISIFLFLVILFNQSLYVLRQCMAMAIVLLSYDKIINREFLKFLLIVSIAFFFHQTAIVFIPIYFLYGIKNKKTLIGVLVAIGIALWIGFEVVYNLMGTLLLAKYAMYLNSDETINATRFLMSLVILVAFIVALKGRVFDMGINKLLFILLVLSTLASYLGTGFAQSDRLFEYYTTCSILAIPITQKYIKTKWIGYLFSIAAIALYYYLSFHDFANNNLFDSKLIFDF